MNEAVAIKLLLDASLCVEAGKNQVMSWAVLNAHPGLAVANLSLTAECGSDDCRLGNAERKTKIEPGKLARIGQPMRVNEPGKYAIRFRVRGTMRGGQRFDLISDDLTFDIRTDGEGRSVTINGGAGGVLVPGDIKADTLRIVTEGVVQLRGKVDAKNIQIDGQGGVILAEGLGEASSESSQESNFRSFRMNEAVEISLHRVVVEGLEALDFKRIAANWRGGSNNSVSVSFIDSYGNALTQAWRHRHEYRVRVTSRVAGYLYLFACGAEGGFMQLTPYVSGSDGRIDVGASLCFPDDLLPLPLEMQGELMTCFEFTAVGTEGILAIVAPTPGKPVPALQLIERVALIDLLEALSHTPSAAGYTEVKVM